MVIDHGVDPVQPQRGCYHLTFVAHQFQHCWEQYLCPALPPGYAPEGQNQADVCPVGQRGANKLCHIRRISHQDAALQHFDRRNTAATGYGSVFPLHSCLR